MKARRPGQSTLLLLDVVRILDAEQIEYAVIGATAAAVHGAVRATLDADALASVGVPGLNRLEKAISREGFATELRRGDAGDPISAVLRVSDKHGNRVDLIVGLRGVDPAAFGRCIEVGFSGKSLRVIGREDFIAMKCFAGGPRDLADARDALEAARDPPIDFDLLKRVTRRFGRNATDALEKLVGPR